jgi:predicted kinase
MYRDVEEACYTAPLSYHMIILQSGVNHDLEGVIDDPKDRICMCHV